MYYMKCGVLKSNEDNYDLSMYVTPVACMLCFSALDAGRTFTYILGNITE